MTRVLLLFHQFEWYANTSHCINDSTALFAVCFEVSLKMVKTGVCYYFGNFEYVSAKVWTSEHIVTDSLIQLNWIKWWVLLEDVLDVFFCFYKATLHSSINWNTFFSTNRTPRLRRILLLHQNDHWIWFTFNLVDLCKFI